MQGLTSAEGGAAEGGTHLRSRLRGALGGTASRPSSSQRHRLARRNSLSRRWHPTLKGDRVTQAVHFLLQVLIVVTQWSKATSLTSRLQPAIAALWQAGLLLVQMLLPQAYWKHRSWLVPAYMMLAMLAMPWHRQAGVGLALILERAPAPSTVGAVWDVLRTLTGIRVLGLTLWSSIMVLSPLSALATHGVLTLLTWTPDYCLTPLLASPLATKRQASIAAALELASLPLAVVQPLAAALLPAYTLLEGDAAADELRHATTSWLHLAVGLLIPILLSAWVWDPPAEDTASVDDAVLHGSSLDRMQQLCRTAQRAALACNWGLHQLFGGSSRHLWLRVLVAWYVLANAWMLCKVSVGL